jgi:hypothetical protein
MLVLFETPAGYAIFKVRTGNIFVKISVNYGLCGSDVTYV